MQAAQSLVLLEGKLEQLASKLALTQQRSDLQSEAFHEERKRLHRQVLECIVLSTCYLILLTLHVTLLVIISHNVSSSLHTLMFSIIYILSSPPCFVYSQIRSLQAEVTAKEEEVRRVRAAADQLRMLVASGTLGV